MFTTLTIFFCRLVGGFGSGSAGGLVCGRAGGRFNLGFSGGMILHVLKELGIEFVRDVKELWSRSQGVGLGGISHFRLCLIK